LFNGRTRVWHTSSANPAQAASLPGGVCGDAMGRARCRSDQTLRSSQARSDPGFREFYSQIGSAALHALSAAFGSHAALGVIWVEEDSRFASARSGFPRAHGERAGGLHGPVAPSAGHEGAPVPGCLLPFMVRPRAPSERPWRCGRPSFPTARRDSLSSRSDNFP
jgi:hypothetical protein